MTFNDGRVGNFVLLPKHKNSLQIAEAVAGVIASWGLSVAAGKLMKIHPKLRAQPEEVHSLGKYLASMGGDLFIPNLFGYLAIKDSGYYEVITKELVITEPVWVPSGR
jgi:hypothetical protein